MEPLKKDFVESSNGSSISPGLSPKQTHTQYLEDQEASSQMELDDYIGYHDAAEADPGTNEY